MFMLKIKIQAFYLHNSYLFRHWLFSWNQDEDGDIAFSIAKRVHFIKYKEHTLVKFGKMNYVRAPKYVRGE